MKRADTIDLLRPEDVVNYSFNENSYEVKLMINVQEHTKNNSIFAIYFTIYIIVLFAVSYHYII